MSLYPEIIMIDLDDGRLAIARRFGATATLNGGNGRAADAVMKLKTLYAHKLDPTPLISHRFKLDQILEAYETFANASETHALKVLIEA